jgi:hypothetical protein
MASPLKSRKAVEARKNEVVVIHDMIAEYI